MELWSNLPGHTQLAVIVVLGLTAVFHAMYSEKTVSYGPTILTTLGIFATFLAIALGLADFNSENIQQGVPALLDSLKTAFWASVVGVGGALTIKLRHFFIGVQGGDTRGSGADGEVTAADLSKQLAAIQHALVGSDDSTLVSQIKLSRQDSNDRLDSLKKAQIEALEKLKEMGTAALIEALKQVIKDFNEKLTEQFGENFKQLNDAVGKLVTWQEQYKAQMEILVKDIATVSEAMKISAENYKELVSKSETFTRVATDLSALLTTLQGQKDQLNTALKALGELLLKASGSLPEIETKVVELTKQLSDAVLHNQQEVDRTLTKNAETHKQLVQALSEAITKLGADATSKVTSFSNDMSNAVHKAHGLVNDVIAKAQATANDAVTNQQKEVNKAIALAHEQTTKSLAASSDQAAKAITSHSDVIKTALTTNSDAIRVSVQTASDGFTKMNQEFGKQVGDLADKTKQQVTVLDAALTEELKKSLESLGRQLTALSSKFVEDYTPLTDRLRQLIQSVGRTP